MFCPSCGSPNPDNAAHCGSCGQRIAAAPPASTALPAAPGAYASALPTGTVPTHMGMAVGALVVNLLGCCLPVFGIVAIVYASQVNSKLALGDLPGAQAASNSAKTWSIIGYAVGALFFLFSIVVNVLGVVLAESGGGF